MDHFAELANKLGLATEQLFPFFVKQQVIEGYYDLGWTLVFVTTFIILMKKVLKIDFGNIDPEPKNIIILFGTVVVGMISMVLVLSLDETVTHITNPQFHAIKSLLNN
jgi:hypothetical protein